MVQRQMTDSKMELKMRQGYERERSLRTVQSSTSDENEDSATIARCQRPLSMGKIAARKLTALASSSDARRVASGATTHENADPRVVHPYSRRVTTEPCYRR